jgi:hypothetical protein
MLDTKWSPAEKKIARAAYDRAYQRECDAILREIESMLRSRGQSNHLATRRIPPRPPPGD